MTERNAQQLARDLYDMSVEELEEAVKHHNYLYWVENAAEIPDPLFDQLVEQLRKRSPDSEVLDAIGPAGAVEVGDPLAYGDKVEHEHPMLSLDKAYSEEEVHKWFDSFEGEAVGSPKVDGIACSIRYQDGRLALAATRGDGTRGDVITENVRRVGDVPSEIDAGDIEVRGEVYMPVSVFQTYADRYANPRNLAAGAIKQKDPEETGNYKLRFFAYDLLGEDHATEEDKFNRLKNLGFEPVAFKHVARDAVQDFYESIVEERDDLDYETDGVVYRTNRIPEQKRLGATSHHPRFAIAYKFQGESGVSTLEDVEWSVSRTGAVNPVAIVKPVTLSGASVTRASLHNLAIIEEMDLTIGSEVLMTRRGGVIPHVERVLEPGDTEIVIPDECPACGGETVRRGDFLYCENVNCKASNLGLLKYFADAVDIKGFGPKLLHKLYENDTLQEPADFYTLNVDELLPLERMGDKLANKLVENVAEKTHLPLDRFLRALAIPDLGKVVARDVAQYFGSIERIRAAGIDELCSIHGIGENVAQSIVDGLEQRRDVIDHLLEHITLEEIEMAPAAVESPISGKSFLFTGTLESMKRKEAQTRVREAGGATPDGVKKDMDFLVIGDADLEKFNEGWRSSKLKKAEKYNDDGSHIQIIGETEFLGMLEDAEAAVEAAGGGERSPSGELAGQSFLFTGALESMKRNQAQERVRSLGGDTPDGVKKDLDFLVIGDADLEKFNEGWRTGKLKKAEKYNDDGSDIRIIGESEFLGMLE